MKMKHGLLMLLILCIVMPWAAAEGETEMGTYGGAEYAIAPEDVPAERLKAWEAYCAAMLADAEAQRETEEKALRFGDAVMRYTLAVVGEKPEEGYPLYIALHGGGASDTPDVNDEQWKQMQGYYKMPLKCGVYAAVRGVRDTWDTHFNPESYPLYDRLIALMILTEDVDPNRVYLEGFSAGGDGVWAVAPRMADRFAAVNMSSGHPNGVQIYNLYNLPIQLQAGEYDTAYSRNTVTAEYGCMLDDLAAEYGGFEHRVLIHAGMGHNYKDWLRTPVRVMASHRAWLENGDRTTVPADPFPPDYMDQFTRDPLPEQVIWDLSTRAPSRKADSFYYLRAPYETDRGMIRAGYSRGANRVWIETDGVEGNFSILLNERMVDFAQPVTFTLNGKEKVLCLEPDRRILERTIAERGDPNYAFEAEVLSVELAGGAGFD